MKIRMVHIGLLVLLTIMISGCLKLSDYSQLPGGSSVPYKEGWEARSGLAAVGVATKGTIFMDGPTTSPWEQIGSKGYAGFYADPDGQYKQSHGYPNLEVEVGGAVLDWFKGLGQDWIKTPGQSDKIVIQGADGSEEGYIYQIDYYTFFVRVSATADIKHVHTWAGANDRFETETYYDASGSLVGVPAKITVYPYFEVDPWQVRENHSVGAWVMKATLEEVWLYEDEVRQEASQHHGYSTGKASMYTATGKLNMYSEVNGHVLQDNPVSYERAPDPDLRPGAYFQLNMEMLPGYYFDSWYADRGELKQIPRDIVCKIKVEVLRTDNWKIAGSQLPENKTRPKRDEEESGWDFLKWNKLSTSGKLLLLLAIGIILLIILGPYLGFGIFSMSSLMSNLGRLNK